MILKSPRMIVVGSTVKNSIQIELKKSLMNFIGLKFLKDHIYPKERPFEDLEVFEAQLVKENMEEYFTQEVSTHEDSRQSFESGSKRVDT